MLFMITQKPFSIVGLTQRRFQNNTSRGHNTDNQSHSPKVRVTQLHKKESTTMFGAVQSYNSVTCIII